MAAADLAAFVTTVVHQPVMQWNNAPNYPNER
jgi:hypothetical protein